MDYTKYLDWMASKFEIVVPAPVKRYAFIGLTARLLLAPFTGTTFDIYPGYASLVSLLGGSPLYGERAFSYPPLFVILVFPLVFLLSLFVEPASFAACPPSVYELSLVVGTISPVVTSPLFNLVYKIPMILADLLVGAIIFRFLSEEPTSQKQAKKAYLFWFLNPLVIHVSAVHGAFDSICVLFTLIAVVFLIKERYFDAGIALGLGVVTKVYPIYLVPLFLGAVVGRSLFARVSGRRVRSMIFLRNLFAIGLGGVLVALLFFMPLLDFLDALSVRASTPVISGMNAGFIQYLPFMNTIAGFDLNTVLIQTVFLMFMVGTTTTVAILLARTWARNGEPRQKAIILSACMMSMIAVFTLPSTFPQYFLWFIPFLALLSEDRQMLVALILFSLGGLLWEYTIQGILAYFYPLAVYTDILSITTINHSILSFLELPGLFNSTLRYDCKLLCGLLTFPTFILVIIKGGIQVARQ